MTLTLAGYRHVREIWPGCHEFSIVRQGRTKSVCDEPRIMALDYEAPVALETVARFQGLRVAHVVRPLGATRDMVLLPYMPCSLTERLAAQAVPPPTALLWLGQIAEALVGLHAQGIIHGEISGSRIVIKDESQAFLLPTVENDLEPADDMFGFGALIRTVWASVNPYRVQKIEAALIALAHECCDLPPTLRPGALAVTTRLLTLGQEHADLLRDVARERLIARALAPADELPSLVPQPPQPHGAAAFEEFLHTETATEHLAEPTSFVAQSMDSRRGQRVTGKQVSVPDLPDPTLPLQPPERSVSTRPPVRRGPFARWEPQRPAKTTQVVKVGKQYALAQRKKSDVAEPGVGRQRALRALAPFRGRGPQTTAGSVAAGQNAPEQTDDLRNAWLHSEEKRRKASAQRRRQALVGTLATLTVVAGVGGYAWQSFRVGEQEAKAKPPAVGSPAESGSALPTNEEMQVLLQRYATQRDATLSGDRSASTHVTDSVNAPGSPAAQGDQAAAAAIAGAEVVGLSTTIADARVVQSTSPPPFSTLEATARVRVTSYTVQRAGEVVTIPAEEFGALFNLQRSPSGEWLIASVARV